MTIIPATPAHAADIAQLIMTAMTEECCQYLAGKEHTLDDFYHMMLDLVLMDDSQYSWRNAFVAVDEEATEGNVEYAPVAGAIVGYNGADLRRLRRRFQEEALRQLGMDYSQMDDETEAGEFYLDSLAIYPEYRRRGIARQLLQRASEHAASLTAALSSGEPTTVQVCHCRYCQRRLGTSFAELAYFPPRTECPGGGIGRRTSFRC